MVESLIESLVTKVTFYPCKLATPYNLRGTFFSVSLSIEECQDDDGQLMAIAVGNVFDMEKENVEYFLAKILPNVVHNKDIPITEKALFHSHVKSIFSCLGSNVVLQSEYKKICKDDPNTNVSCSSLGMGALGTWHGYPDGRVRGNSQQSSTTIVYSSDDEDSSLSDTDTCLTGVLNESQGDSACIEAKLHCSPLNFPQLVSTNIVASFVEHNLHKTLNSAVPTILINSHCFYISIYDCCRDLLLISNKIVFKNEDELVASGILLLYLTINHRDTLRLLKPKQDEMCGFKEYATHYGVIQNYEQLKEKDITWLWRPSLKIEVPACKRTLSSEPPPKKRKISD